MSHRPSKSSLSKSVKNLFCFPGAGLFRVDGTQEQLPAVFSGGERAFDLNPLNRHGWSAEFRQHSSSRSFAAVAEFEVLPRLQFVNKLNLGRLFPVQVEEPDTMSLVRIQEMATVNGQNRR